MINSIDYRKITLLLFLVITLFTSKAINVQAEVKVLSNSSHAASHIRSTVTELLGAGHIDVDVIVHRTYLDNTYTYTAATALDTDRTNYETANTNATNSAPYQIYTSSFTGYQGDTVSIYNQFDGVDLVHNYAFTVSTDSPPPAFHVAPGGTAFGSKSGIEWTIDGTEITFSGPSPTLSELTARSSALLASVRYDHPSWNWFDVKAAIRQTASNWTTGYDDTTYGFGNAFYASSTALADGEILLQPPAAEIATTSVGQVEFTLYPFKQTRRVKEVLFQFASDPGFQADELSLNDITVTHGGTKIMERNDTTAIDTLIPIYAPLTNAYFVWFTADNADDNSASFSRIDTYSVLGPISQNRIDFSTTFDLSIPANNSVVLTLPTFSWTEPVGYLGVAKYQLYIDGVLVKDNITGTSTTLVTPLTDGGHTWHIVATNGDGATTTSISTRSFNFLPEYVTSQTWYVDNLLGDDSNPGTEADPWATISKAADIAQPGNTVMVIKNEGVPYREQVSPNNGNTDDGNIVFRGVDSLNKPEIWGSIDVSQATVGDWTVYGGGNANTYQRTMSNVDIVAVGSSLATLEKRTSSTSNQDLLNEGEWVYATGTLYYRLDTGEDIDTLHIEAGQEDIGLYCTESNTYQDFIVRYVNKTAVRLLGQGCIGERLEIYDSVYGALLFGSGSETNPSPTLKYSVLAGNDIYGIYLQITDFARVYNNTTYGNGTGMLIWYWGDNAIVRNNIFIDNTSNISFNIFRPNTNFVASNNNWYAGTIASEWTDTYQGTNNQASTSPLLVDATHRDFGLQSTSPNIDAGIAIGSITDVLGNPIYGTPDIGAYEYQPPYTIGSDNINTTGTIRLYADGKYRYLNTPSGSNTVTLNVAPVGGFGTGDYSEYLNLSIDTWEADSADAIKSWTASSSYATSTVFSIPGLAGNTSYDIKIDGSMAEDISGSNCDAGACTTTSGGTLTFTYGGSWSTHSFVIERSVIPEPAISSSGGGGRSNRSVETTETEETEEENLATTTDEALRQSLLARIAELQQLIATLTAQLNAQKTTNSYQFHNKLKVGDENLDVLNLQKKLNSLGFTVAPSGAGAPGQETTYYGPRTTAALKLFQCQYNIVCSGTPETTGYGNFGPMTRAKMNGL